MIVGVTGALGFVGSAIVRMLLAQGDSVVPIVRKRSGLANERVIGPIEASDLLAEAVSGCDAIVHCAARVHMMDDRAGDPLAVFRAVNVAGTLALARAAAAAGVRRFIFISSIKVNGESTTPATAFTAGDVPAPGDPYGVSKLEAEQGLWEVAAKTGLEVIVIRPPLVFGPGVGANFRAMIAWLAKGRPLPLGAIDNRRSLVGIGNLCDLVSVCLSREKLGGATFLVSDGEDVSTTTLLRMIRDALGSRAALLPVPGTIVTGLAGLLGKGAQAQRLTGNLQVDIAATRARLDWSPPVPLAQEIARTVAAFKA